MPGYFCLKAIYFFGRIPILPSSTANYEKIHPPIYRNCFSKQLYFRTTHGYQNTALPQYQKS